MATVGESVSGVQFTFITENAATVWFQNQSRTLTLSREPWIASEPGPMPAAAPASAVALEGADSEATGAQPHADTALLTDAAAEAMFYSRLNRLPPDQALRLKAVMAVKAERSGLARRAAAARGLTGRQ